MGIFLFTNLFPDNYCFFDIIYIVNRKFITSIGIMLLSILCTFLFSNQAILLSIILVLIAYAKHKIYPIKKELLLFILISVGGAVVEILLVNSGSAWNYSSSQLFGIPFWIPFFWGVMSTTIVVLYDGLINRTSSKK